MFSRKKPPQPSILEELQQTYTDCCDQTIKNLTLEEHGNFEDALKGWKSLHTSLLYKIELFEKISKLSPTQENILNELKGIRDQNVKHLIRVQLRLDELNRMKKREANGAPPPPPPPRRSNQPQKSVPSLRVSPPSANSSATVPRGIMKSLRSNANGSHPTPKQTTPSSSLVSASVKQASQAATVSWQRPITWQQKYEASKSNYKNKTEEDLFQDFDQEVYEVGKSSSRTSSGISELSNEQEEKSLIDLEDDQVHKFNSLHSNSYQYSPETAISKSMDDLTIKPIESPPHKFSQKIEPVESNETKRKLVSKSWSEIPKEKPKVAASKKPYVYNKPKPMNLKRLMQQSPSKSQKPTKPSASPITSQTVVKQKTKPASNITYNYVKAKSPPQKVGNAKSMTKTSASNGNSLERPPSKKLEEPPHSPTMDDLLSGYENDDIDDVLTKDRFLTNEKDQDQLISSIRGIDPVAAKQILNDIVVRGDEVYWDDIIGLESAKNSLKEAVVYPFLRPDLFRGLREPTRGMLLFGPPGTGKTMLARAVATESQSTFFSISASSLTSKYLGESEKLVKALFLLAKKLAPSIVFMDEIDSLLGSRTEGELESMRRIKNEFLVSWSELSSAAAGRDSDNDDESRVLVLGATNLPWSIDEAARRRFVRRQYIPLPEGEARVAQIRKLLQYQKNTLSENDYEVLKNLTEGFSGSDITALTKDSAMGPLRVLGEKLLSTPTDQIRPISLEDFVNSLNYIRPSVSKEGLRKHEEWARKFGSSGV
ncbi:uncharacterized protein SPAPADRAFT_48889 [Spathaspora passalidarum NRRL Y-27907]|uniref:AAA+ ATPase domain-containing protein n=1 Tax=Spathaspora passalidarum (strain NRRL Y-27907 / 11-Y1) TaxID=619300 RepID=G3AIW1_SPAPN|nr:uncharacterized protein SPAPADRAFT_48889 [Spathaspora passalidarum NRRL Y-27907]EGW33772.1 hypothetical protein SPAPADRAFT_48889 [Spathaspora passalidarum NRRL Y-27907]